MNYSSHIYAFAFIIILILFVRFIFRKQELHFKLLKEMYPNKFNKINSIYNPLFGFYLFQLDIGDYFWFVSPMFYFRSKHNRELDSYLIDKLMYNNSRIIWCIFLFIVWFFIGLFFLF